MSLEVHEPGSLVAIHVGDVEVTVATVVGVSIGFTGVMYDLEWWDGASCLTGRFHESQFVALDESRQEVGFHALAKGAQAR